MRLPSKSLKLTTNSIHNIRIGFCARTIKDSHYDGSHPYRSNTPIGLVDTGDPHFNQILYLTQEEAIYYINKRKGIGIGFTESSEENDIYTFIRFYWTDGKSAEINDDMYKNFIPIEEYRNNQINILLNE